MTDGTTQQKTAGVERQQPAIGNGTAALEAAAIDPKTLRAIQLLDAWDEVTREEVREQQETWAFLKKALDEDRLSPERKLFS